MEVIYWLIPIAVLFVCLIVAVFFWAVKNGQFDDLEGPAHRILLDDDEKNKDSSMDLNQSNSLPQASSEKKNQLH